MADFVKDIVQIAYWKTMKEEYEKMTPRQKRKFLKKMFPDKKEKEGN